jgi:hypothetical protein
VQEEVLCRKAVPFFTSIQHLRFNAPRLLRSSIPLHYAAINITTSIQEFQVVFEYGIRYYPNKKGINLLFKKSNTGATPFFMACVASGYALHGWKDNVEWTPLTTAGFHHGRDIVMNVIEETLLDCQRRSDDNNNNNTGPYNIVDTLITAAIDEGVHLDYVYFLLRRHPDVLIQLLSSTSVAVAGPNNTNNGGGGDDDGNNRHVGTDITSATASNYIIDANSELSVKQQQEDNINENEGCVYHNNIGFNFYTLFLLSRLSEYLTLFFFFFSTVTAGIHFHYFSQLIV